MSSQAMFRDDAWLFRDRSGTEGSRASPRRQKMCRVLTAQTVTVLMLTTGFWGFVATASKLIPLSVAFQPLHFATFVHVVEAS